MKIIQLYKQNPIFALIMNCVGFFIWAMTVIWIMVVLTVAFTN